MVLIKHNYLKSDIFFDPIFIPGFSGSRFLRSGSRIRIQGPGPGYGSSRQIPYLIKMESKMLRSSRPEVFLGKGVLK